MIEFVTLSDLAAWSLALRFSVRKCGCSRSPLLVLKSAGKSIACTWFLSIKRWSHKKRGFCKTIHDFSEGTFFLGDPTCKNLKKVLFYGFAIDNAPFFHRSKILSANSTSHECSPQVSNIQW